MLKDCFSKPPELKIYILAMWGYLYTDEDCFFGSGDVNGYTNFDYIEAFCAEEARNLYRVLNPYYEKGDVEVLGIYTSECGEEPVYHAYKDRPERYKKFPRHVGKNLNDVYKITDKQWEAIENLSEATKSKFEGITKLEASCFICNKSEEVAEWKKNYLKNKADREDDYEYYYDEQEDYDMFIGW